MQEEEEGEQEQEEQEEVQGEQEEEEEEHGGVGGGPYLPRVLRESWSAFWEWVVDPWVEGLAWRAEYRFRLLPPDRDTSDGEERESTWRRPCNHGDHLLFMSSLLFCTSAATATFTTVGLRKGILSH